MFRTAMLRSAFRAASAAAPAAARPATQRTAVLAAPRAALPRLRQTIAPVRMYGAAACQSKEQVEGRIMSLLQGFDKVNDASNIKPTAHFANDLGLDSLDTVEVVMAIEEEFSIEIPDDDADTIHSVDKAVEYILSQPDAN